MSRITVASVCSLMGLSDPARNMQTLDRWCRRAQQAGADLVLFPEMFITGYGEDFMYANGYADKERFLSLAQVVPGPITEALAGLAGELGIFICAGLLEEEHGTPYNTQVMIDPSRGYLGKYRKIQVSSHEEWFSQPGGDWPVFDVGGISTGIMICRDKSHPEVARILALEGAILLLAPHACTQREMDFTTWSLKICTVRAMENGCYVIANNNIYDCPMSEDRSQGGFTFAIDPYGEVVHCDQGAGDEEKMALITVDSDVVRARRDMEGPGFNLFTRRPEVYGRLVSGPAGPRRAVEPDF